VARELVTVEYKTGDVNPADNPYAPRNCLPEALHTFGELRHYMGVPREGPLPEEMARSLVHGYYAATSYVDAQIGRILDELDNLGLSGNTIVLIFGDHGWQLGEHGLWCKHCNFDTSLHAPLIVRMPDDSGGKVCDGLVEFVDIYPMLCELSGLPSPEHLHGESLASLIGNPSGPGRDAVYSRYHAAESVRSGQYLYTQFRVPGRSETPHMLYDHNADEAENINIADDPARSEAVTRLSSLLEEHRRKYYGS
jgi:iduronate 2-sulfatase